MITYAAMRKGRMTSDGIDIASEQYARMVSGGWRDYLRWDWADNEITNVRSE